MNSKVYLPEDLVMGHKYKFVLLEDEDKEHLILFCGDVSKIHHELVLRAMEIADVDDGQQKKDLNVCGGGYITITPTRLRAWGRSKNYGSPPKSKMESVLASYLREKSLELELDLDAI